MNEVLQTNIFFIITSIAVVAVTIMVGVALYYVIRILRAVKDVAERVREGSAVIAEDVAHVRQELLSGNIFSAIFSKFTKMAGMSRSSSRRSRKTEKSADESEDSATIHRADNKQ